MLTSGRNLDWMKGRSLTSASASAQYSLRTGEAEEEGGEGQEELETEESRLMDCSGRFRELGGDGVCVT